MEKLQAGFSSAYRSIKKSEGGLLTLLACIALIVLPPWRLTRLVPDILILDDIAILLTKIPAAIPLIKKSHLHFNICVYAMTPVAK
jgi:hypothetical protein